MRRRKQKHRRQACEELLAAAALLAMGEPVLAAMFAVAAVLDWRSARR